MAGARSRPLIAQHQRALAPALAGHHGTSLGSQISDLGSRCPELLCGRLGIFASIQLLFVDLLLRVGHSTGDYSAHRRSTRLFLLSPAESSPGRAEGDRAAGHVPTAGAEPQRGSGLPSQRLQQPRREPACGRPWRVFEFPPQWERLGSQGNGLGEGELAVPVRGLTH